MLLNQILKYKGFIKLMFSLEKAVGNLISVCRYLMEANEDKGSRLFSVVLTDRI